MENLPNAGPEADPIEHYQQPTYDWTVEEVETLPEGRWVRTVQSDRLGQQPRRVKWQSYTLNESPSQVTKWVKVGEDEGLTNRHPPVLGRIGTPLDAHGRPLKRFSSLKLSPNDVLYMVRQKNDLTLF